MVDPQLPFDLRFSVSRRRFLKGAAAVGVIGCVSGDHHPSSACGGQPDGRQFDSLAFQSIPRHLEQGWRRVRQVGRRRLRDAGDRGQQREGHRRHQGDFRQDERQLRHQRRPERQSGRPADRPGVQGRRRLRGDLVEQAQRSAPLDFNPNYVAHISFSGVPYGKAMAETLIKAMGGKGGSSPSAASNSTCRRSNARLD